MEAKGFINYYELLEISPSASSEAIEHSFRNLARRYHPDNQDTGSRSKFDAVIEAHNTLKDEAKRAKYHEDNPGALPLFSDLFSEEVVQPGMRYASRNDDDSGFVDGLGIDRDISIQNHLLILLYLQRRRNIREPGIGNAELERLSGCAHEHLEFHIWYLRAKGWICTEESGLLAITIDGVDRAAQIYQANATRLISDNS